MSDDAPFSPEHGDINVIDLRRKLTELRMMLNTDNIIIFVHASINIDTSIVIKLIIVTVTSCLKQIAYAASTVKQHAWRHVSNIMIAVRKSPFMTSCRIFEVIVSIRMVQ